MDKKWQIAKSISHEFINKFPEINNIVLQLLYNRGLTEQNAIDGFLNPSYENQILDPFLFSDMGKAVDRIFEAMQKEERVMIYGDYDADGVCATAILFETLKSLGLNVDIYIPFRESEGYGLNKEITQQIINQEFTLVITVDCGIANKAEIDLFNQNKVDVIITDHHLEPVELPQALAIINPSLDNSGYPFSKLCGAGVAFKLVQAIIKQEKKTAP